MSELLFPGNPSYNQPLEDSLSNSLQDIVKIFELNLGKYTIKYNFYNSPFGYFPRKSHQQKWHSIRHGDNPVYKWPNRINVEVYEENKLIRTKSTFYTPCINLYGSGINPEDTFYTIIEDFETMMRGELKLMPKFNIYNMNGNLVKSMSFCWYSLNIDIRFTKYNDVDYIICFDNNILLIEKFNPDNDRIGISSDNHTILPMLGQNFMYVTSIADNVITFNNNRVCKIDNILYDVSKFLLIGNDLYRHLLVNSPFNKDRNEDKKKHFVVTCGKFSAEYDYSDHQGRFDSNIGKFAANTKVTFKENGENIFEMDSGSSPSLIIHGDGETREGTRFCIGSVRIYDFNQKLIRTTQIGADSHHDIQRVNEKFAISTSIEVCTWSQFSGLIDLDKFFSQTGEEEPHKPYDNARTFIPMVRDDDVTWATCADENGFILNNGLIVPYELAADFDFSLGEEYAQFDFSKLGYSEEQIKQINDYILRGQTGSIPFNSD